MTDHAPCMMDRDDVQIEPWEPPLCEDCEGAPGTHFVTLDLRNNGMKISLTAQQCLECATDTAERLRESLPESKEPPR